MKSKTIKELVDQGISINLNGGMYEVNISGKSTTIFKSFGDAMDFGIKKLVIGESMVGFNESDNITLDDAIRHLEVLCDDEDIDSYTEDVINMVVRFLKG